MKLSLIKIDEKQEIIIVNKKKRLFFVKEENTGKKIKNAYVTFLPSELLTKNVSLSKKIKKSLISSIIKAKIAKDLKEDFVFRYQAVEETDEEIVYQVQILKKEEIFEAIKNIPEKSEIKFITTHFHSLFFVSSKYFKNDDFISVFVQKNAIVYVMGKEKPNLFRQNSKLETVEEMAEDINRTILWFKQQSKKGNLTNILISGNNELITQITPLINASFSQPLNFEIENVSNKDFCEKFIFFGLIDNPYDFMLPEIKTLRRFNDVYLTALFVLSVFLLCLIYLSINKWTEIENNRVYLINKKNEFLNLKKNTKLLPKNKLDYYLNFLTLYEKSEKSDFLKQLSKIKPLLIYFKPKEILVNNRDIRVTFEKQYKTFKALIYAKNDIENAIKTIKPDIYDLQTDYENKKITLILIIKRKYD